MKKEFKDLEDQLDAREDELEAEYRAKKLERKDYTDYNKQLDRVEDYLDGIEEQLELKFGVDD